MLKHAWFLFPSDKGSFLLVEVAQERHLLEVSAQRKRAGMHLSQLWCFRNSVMVLPSDVMKMNHSFSFCTLLLMQLPETCSNKVIVKLVILFCFCSFVFETGPHYASPSDLECVPDIDLYLIRYGINQDSLGLFSWYPPPPWFCLITRMDLVHSWLQNEVLKIF